MNPITEQDVAAAAHVMGYDLVRLPFGYALAREHRSADPEIIHAPSLELITNFLKH
jgi:hypothetical protein